MFCYPEDTLELWRSRCINRLVEQGLAQGIASQFGVTAHVELVEPAAAAVLGGLDADPEPTLRADFERDKLVIRACYAVAAGASWLIARVQKTASHPQRS
jgi:hypothetical protein